MSYETGINIAITKLVNDLDLTTLDKQELLSYIESLESKLDFICDSTNLPEGLKDCKIYGIQNGNSISLSVVRCPNSTVSTTYKSGKTTTTTVVIEGKKYVSEE